MPTMQKLLYIDKFPVFLTLMLGLLGYQINTLTKTTLDTPTIEYKNTDKKLSENNIYHYEYTIQNISSTKSFRGLTINFMFKESSKNKLFSPDIIVVNPSSLHNIETDEQDSLIVEYRIKHLQPNQTYKLLFNATIENNEHPKIFLTTDASVRLVNGSFSTWLVKNYVFVNIFLVVFWVITIMVYLFTISKQKEV